MVLPFSVEIDMWHLPVQMGILFKNYDLIIIPYIADAAFRERPLAIILSHIVPEDPLWQFKIFSGIKGIKIASNPMRPLDAEGGVEALPDML